MGSPLSLTLTAPDKARVGETVRIDVRIRNDTKGPLWVVGVLDGSEGGVRYPHFVPEISTRGDALAPKYVSECGMVSPLRIGDFRLLAPGESFDPTVPVAGAAYLPIRAFSQLSLPRPDTYDISLTFSSESNDPSDWLGVLEYPGHEAVRDRLLEVPRVRLVAATKLQIEE